jgi:hypothetical protein
MALMTVAAAQAPTALRDQIIADARTQPPAGLVFDRTTALVRTGGGSTTNVSMVERWDGKSWTLISHNGKPPSASQRRAAEKQAAAAPVPGYHRLASLLANASGSRIDSDGRTVLEIPILPANSVRTDTADISSHLKAEAVIDNRGGKPFVESVHVSARESFMLNALIKVKAFDLVSSYQRDSKGRPRLASQTADSQGSLLGFPGGESSQVTFTYH